MADNEIREARRAFRVVRLDLENLHFCKDNKVRYRKHLTIGTIVGLIASIIGTSYGIPWLCHVGAVVNGGTCVIWIWE